MRTALLGIVCLAAGCAALQSTRDRTKRAAPAETEESGIKEISKLLRESNHALAAKLFEESNKLLRRAEKGVATASAITRSHPDFEDLESAVGRARTRLEAAIEADRIARRNAAIDDLIRRGELKVGQGTALFGELRSRFPSQQDVDDLTEIVAALDTMRTDGDVYMDEARYEAHAADRDVKMQALRQRRDQAVWQRQAADRIDREVESAYQAASTVEEAETPEAFTDAFRRTGAGFARCAGAIADLKTQAQYRDSWLIETRLGVKTLAATKKLCIEREAKARKEGDKREWEARVNAIVDQIAQPVALARAAKRAGDALEASTEAIAKLRTCQAALDKSARHAGSIDSKVFDTVLGKLTQARLRQACAAEEVRLLKAQPGLKWKSAFEGVTDRLASTGVQIERAKSTSAAQERVEAWRSAIGGLKECIERCRTLGRDRAADRSFVVATPFGRLGVVGLEKDCRRQLADATKKLAEATADAELAQFLTTCRGDEVAVARREGIPARIETVEGGRMFVYEKGKGRRKETRHFGFDTAGKRVDFRLRWLSDVGTVVGELNRVLRAIGRAKTGDEALRTTTEALPVLEVCVEALQDAEKSPGFDAAAVFTTALGKLSAAKLKRACSGEHAKRAKSLVGLEWRVRFERLRDRVDEAQSAIGKAAAATDVARRLELIGSAIGGYTECGERVGPLASEPGADKSLTATSTHGDLNLRGFSKVCAAQLKQAQKALDKAMAAKELEDFLASCQADEKAVARRQGMPTRVEETSGGRIFIYEAKSRRKTKTKRFAFDADGKRVDEKILRTKKGKRR